MPVLYFKVHAKVFQVHSCNAMYFEYNSGHALEYKMQFRLHCKIFFGIQLETQFGIQLKVQEYNLEYVHTL